MAHKPVELNFTKIHRGFEFRPEFNNKKYCQIIKKNAVNEISKFLDFRYKMYNDCYFDSSVIAVELMVADIFKEADRFSDFSKKIQDKEYFLKIDDSILKKTKKYQTKSKKLKELYDDFEQKRFYAFCEKVEIQCEYMEKMSKKAKSDKMKQVLKEIMELFESQNSDNPVVARCVTNDSQKDVNFAEFLVESEEGHVGPIIENEELMKLFRRKQMFCVMVFVKRYENMDIVKCTIQKWKNKNKELYL